MVFPARTLQDTLPSLPIPKLFLNPSTNIHSFPMVLKFDLETYSRKSIQDWKRTQAKLAAQRCTSQSELWELAVLPFKSHAVESIWATFAKPHQLPDWPICVPDFQTVCIFQKVELDFTQARMEDRGEIGMELIRKELEVVEEPVLVSMLHTDAHSLYRVIDTPVPGTDLSLRFASEPIPDFNPPFKLKPTRVKERLPGFTLELPAASPITFPSNIVYKDIKALQALKTPCSESVFFHDDSQCKLIKTYVNVIERKELPSILTHGYQMNAYDIDSVRIISKLPNIDGLHTSQVVHWERKYDLLKFVKLKDSENRSDILKKVETRFAEMMKNSNKQIKASEFITPKSPKRTVCSLKIPETTPASSAINFASTPFPPHTPNSITSSPSVPFPATFTPIDLTSASAEITSSICSILENESSQFGPSFSLMLSRMMPGVTMIKVPEEHMVNIDFILSPHAGIMICTADVLRTEKACSALLRTFDTFAGRFEKLLVLCLVKETQNFSTVRKVFAFIEMAKFLEMEIFFEFCYSETEVEDVTRSFLNDTVCSYSLPPRPGHLTAALQKCPMLNCYSAMLIESVVTKEKVDLVGLLSESGSGREMLSSLGIHSL